MRDSKYQRQCLPLDPEYLPSRGRSLRLAYRQGIRVPSRSCRSTAPISKSEASDLTANVTFISGITRMGGDEKSLLISAEDWSHLGVHWTFSGVPLRSRSDKDAEIDAKLAIKCL
ncbi:hypothetical protein PoB_005466700 [Plakobranchus ocellatus]|uniref:Uncharacterized protein n=1 Tax=Plakobranchus ocellatus TaxID=259542 RepID=A0AAV4C9X0_9GAST|nr:hypothetical protein PoB_005466700 [Plakobranchus ocellatus]